MKLGKPFVILGLLAVLGSALLLPATTYAKSASHSNDSRQTTKTVERMPLDSGYTYFFSAGWAGFGVCLSHDALQGLLGLSEGAGFGYVFIKAIKGGAPWPAAVTAAAGYAFLRWWLNQFDRGRGVCLYWPAWIPSATPIPSSQ